MSVSFHLTAAAEAVTRHGSATPPIACGTSSKRSASAMLTTHSVARASRTARWIARPDRRHSLIWFVTDVRGTKDDEIETHPDIGLVLLVDSADKAYLSLSLPRHGLARSRQGRRNLEEDRRYVVAKGRAIPNVRVLRASSRSPPNCGTARQVRWPPKATRRSPRLASPRATWSPDLGENRKSTVAIGFATAASSFPRTHCGNR